ncbi:RidA family protein [Myxosarcina sp. GI1(2024)]
MNKQIIRTNRAPAPVGPYNQAIAASGKMLFVAGQIPLDSQTGEIVGGDIAEQTKQIMKNIEAILNEAGSDWTNVVKTSIFLTDLANFAEINRIYSQYFSEGAAPARSCFEVSRLPKDVPLEIECIAML